MMGSGKMTLCTKSAIPVVVNTVRFPMSIFSGPEVSGR